MAEKNKPESKDPSAAPSRDAVAPERTNFKKLLLSNLNYFGTFPDLPDKVVFPKKFDTAFEELTCLGLNPQQNKLEAVFNIKRNTGYNSGPCEEGSREFVRFFVQHGAVWQDLGKVEVDVFNIPGPMPLSYSVSIDFPEPHKFCAFENILNVRAILSWNIEPTAGDHNFNPPWGNVLDARVQVAPFQIHAVAVGTLIEEGLIKVESKALAGIDLSQPLPAKEIATPTFAELKELYAKADVPSHRFGFAEAQKLLAHPTVSPLPTSAAKMKVTDLVPGAELGAIIAALDNQSGNTGFEEMLCAGYNPQTRELEAVVEIKRNAGYSGGLCTPGSTEYVSFFAFFNGAWQSLGTATVNVHDLDAVQPGKPLMYAVRRISNMIEFPCSDIKGLPLRAILSWNQQPTGPNFSPTWGNVINTHIQPIIGEPIAGEHLRLMRVGGVTIDRISNISNLAYPRNVADPAHGLAHIAGDCTGDDSPFGGEIIVEGDFTVKPDVFNHVTGLVLPFAKPIIYQVWIQRTDIPSAPFQLTNAFNIALFPPAALTPPVTFNQHVIVPTAPVLGGVAGTEYYQYMESNLQAVNPRTLGVFEAGGLTEGDYQIEVRAWIFNSVNYVPIPSQFKTIHVFNGFKHLEVLSPGDPPVTVFQPQVELTLTSIHDCDDAVVGDHITGKYKVTDKFFRSASIALVPITVSGSPVLEPAITVTPVVGALTYDGTNTTGSQGDFDLDTTGMTPCGYTIELVAHDRAIVDSHCYDHWNRIGVGFCLRKPPEA